MKNKLYLVITLLLLTSCKSAIQHMQDVQNAKESTDSLTVGIVQKEIKVGMSGAEVATVLGSPNIVTSDENQGETWVYDKVSTEEVHSRTKGGVNILILGISDSAGASSRTQKTLTVVVKFDKNKKVRDFAYHTSRF